MESNTLRTLFFLISRSQPTILNYDFIVKVHLIEICKNPYFFIKKSNNICNNTKKRKEKRKVKKESDGTVMNKNNN